MSTFTDATCPPTSKLRPEESTAATIPENLRICSLACSLTVIVLIGRTDSMISTFSLHAVRAADMQRSQASRFKVCFGILNLLHPALPFGRENN